MNFFHNHAPVFGYPDFIKFFEIGCVNRQEFDPFVNGQSHIFGFQEDPVVERQPADVAVKI
jgi:hypothetical protein